MPRTSRTRDENCWTPCTRGNAKWGQYFQKANRKPFDRREHENQPANIGDPSCAKGKEELAARLTAKRKAPNDPRVVENGDAFDKYPYYGGQPSPGQKPKGKRQMQGHVSQVPQRYGSKLQVA